MTSVLGLCSAYSLLYGVHKPGKLLDRAVSYGAKTVSICDIDNLYGLHSFLEEAQERNIRPIIGAALTNKKEKITNSNERIANNGAEKFFDSLPPAPCYLYCFVENRIGFGRLCELLTLRNRDKDNFDPLLHLREDSAGLVMASSDEEVLKKLSGHVRRLYAAITPGNIRAANAGRKLNIPLAFLDDSVFLEPDDYAVHRVLRAISLLKTTGSLEGGDTAEEGRIFRPEKAHHRLLASWPEALRGTEEITALCQFNKPFDGFVFPSYGNDPEHELRRRIYDGAELRYGELGDMETGRIEYELDIITKKGFAPYFLVIDDIVKMAESSGGVDRTCGRGSGAASIVSYALGITNVDPLAHNLYFERFLNPSRSDPPDIDIDFAWDERDDLIKAVIERFGSDRCARVANHNFFRFRSALRETAKAYGFPDAAISRHERKVFDLREKDNGDEPLWREIYGIASRIDGLPRGLGMHCGGLVIAPGPLRRLSPVEKSAEGYPLLAWEKEGAEAAGFVKIDLLGNRSLAVIRDALKNLDEQGIEINPYTWRPVEDEETIDALARGDSIGVFYIESPAMRQLQIKTGKGDFDHIVIHSSIIRPAANKFISEYVRRLKGGKWKPLHPRLEKILDESYGILCYQEDVSKTAEALAGFNEADADKLRKVIAKKMGGTKLAVYKNQFFEGCLKNNVGEKTTEMIWAMMLSFDGYSFCKPHSASYAMVSFQSAYLRTHHPAEFMAAVLSNQGGYYRPHAYIAEARRMRLLIDGPDINNSRWKYYGRSNGNEQIANNGGIFRGTVVIGLMAVKGLSVSGAKAVLAERERGGDYSSLEDFSRRVSLNRDDIIALCPAGVFDSIANGLPRTLQARRLLGNIREQTKNNKEKNGELFAAEAGPFFGSSAFGGKPSSIAPSLNIRSKKNENNLWEEYRALGFLRKSHPLTLWADAVRAQKDRVKALHIAAHVGRAVKMIGWPVTQKDVWTKDGLMMAFLSLEDETAIYETVIFPEVFDRYNKLLFDQHPLLVYGKVICDQEAISLEIHRIELLEEKPAVDTLPKSEAGSPLGLKPCAQAALYI